MRIRGSYELFNRIAAVTSQVAAAAILMSGMGSNAEVILRNQWRYPNIRVLAIVTDKPTSNAKLLSTRYNLTYIEMQAFMNSSLGRQVSFESLSLLLSDLEIDMLLYAGFMKIVPDFFVEQFPGINVHPADLTILDERGRPKYIGMTALGDALAAGEEYIASTAHVVEHEVDCGLPIAVSKPLPTLDLQELTITEIHQQLKQQCEHVLYTTVLSLLAEGKLQLSCLPLYWKASHLVCGFGDCVFDCVNPIS